MFREMRRSNQQLTMEETQNILQKGTSGVLSLLGDEGYPYGVPLSYVYDGEKLYFHCAKTGHKIDAVHREIKASFCVIDQDLIMPKNILHISAVPSLLGKYGFWSRNRKNEKL